VIYTVLLILYATGMRIGEALRLRLQDVDLESGTLLVRDSKFFKSRVVPISASLAEAIRKYLLERLKAAASPEAFLFLNHRSRPYSPDKFAQIFRGLQVTAGIPRVPGQRGPRVHDIRHTFAVNCLLRWYREGADLEAKLPLLATYMGHVDIFSTQDYLNATPELLEEASKRFQKSYGSLINV
jgi:integrase